MDGLARLFCLLQAAREVAADASLIELLVASTGLSPAGVRLGMASYLETNAREDELRGLIARAEPAPHVHVVLSANVFTAPLRALLVACAASNEVTVRPSSRDPVFTRALVRACDRPWLRLEESRGVSSLAAGEVHVYGRDATVAAVRGAAQPGVRVRAHGAGLGVAVVTQKATLQDAAREIADDVVVFDQRGCLSPRVVVVEGDEERGRELARDLSARLTELERAVPRGRLDEDEQREAARYVETMAFAGNVMRRDVPGFAGAWSPSGGGAHVVGFAPGDTPLLVPPPGRHVHVASSELGRTPTLLVPITRLVVAVGCDDVPAMRARWPDEARVRWSRLGQMQRPPLDGPVDLR